MAPESSRADGKLRVRSVERTVKLLEALSHGGHEGANLTQLARTAELAEPTALRYLLTLSESGLVDYQPATRTYRLGVSLLMLVERAFRVSDVRQVALPYMTRLRESYSQTVNLGAIVGDHVVLIEVLEGDAPIKKGARVGEHDALHSTALGKAILASMDPAELAALLDGFEFTPFTEHTITSRAALERRLEEVRERGYALDEEESVIGLGCVAAAIHDRRGEPAWALSISAPISSLSLEKLHMIGPQLIESTAEISSMMGYVRRDG